jgi:hemolysin activation/secretion protein
MGPRGLESGWRVPHFKDKTRHQMLRHRRVSLANIAVAALFCLVTGFFGAPEQAAAQTRPRPATNLQAPPDSQIENWKQDREREQAAPLQVPSLRSSVGSTQPENDQGKPLFRLSRVSIDGASTLAAEGLAARYQSYLARDVSQAVRSYPRRN